MKELASGILHSPTLLTFVCFATLSAFFLDRALYGDQSTYLVHYFWPGVVCFLVAAIGLVSWLVRRFGPAK